MLTGQALASSALTLSYVKTREQFGRLIGVNQAVKHVCADMAVRCYAAESLLHFAALAARDGRHDAAFQAAAAKRIASDAARNNSADTIQMHGAIGYTWEHDAHRFVSRRDVVDIALGESHVDHHGLLASAPAVP
jgi:alkylation response protein AidB-like acyl-CoA dehydrogenase